MGEKGKKAKVNLRFGLDIYSDESKRILNNPNQEGMSEKLYRAIQNKTYSLSRKSIVSKLKRVLGDMIYEVYDAPLFKVRIGNDITEVGTSLLLVTVGGLISINIVNFAGRVTGKETTDWYFWKGESSCRLNASILLDVNEHFIKPLQDEIKAKLSKDLKVYKAEYIRNLIVFQRDAEILVYDSHEVDKFTSNDVEYNPKYVSKQVLTIDKLEDTLYWYIRENISRIDNKALNAVIGILNKIKVGGRVFKFRLPSKFVDEQALIGKSERDYTVLETIDEEVEGIESKDVDNRDTKKGIKGIKTITGKSLIDLESKVNEFISSSDRVVKDIKISDDMLSCILIMG